MMVRSLNKSSVICFWLIFVVVVQQQIDSVHSDESDNQDEVLKKKILLNGDHDLSPEELGLLVKDFGQQIGALMDENVENLLHDLEKTNLGQNDSDINLGHLRKFRDAKRIVAKDAEIRITAAGKASTGEVTEFNLGETFSSGKNYLVNKINNRLQQAGSYIGNQMTLLTNLAPGVRHRLQKIPRQISRFLRWPSFFNFKVKFNKVYKSLSAELYRQMVYLKKQTLVSIQNLKFFFGRVRHLLISTQFADMTDKEYVEIFNNTLADTPASFDGRAKADKADRLYLVELRKQKKNIFGLDMSSLFRKSAEGFGMKNDDAPAKPRVRRSVHEIDESDEEDEDEDEYDDPLDNGNDDSRSIKRSRDSDDESSSSGEDEFEDPNQFQAVDDFVNGFHNEGVIEEAELENQMDGLLDDSDEKDDDEERLDDEDLEDLREEGEQFEPVDWSKHRCMPVVDNQNNCGSCYAYAITTLASFYNCMGELKTNPDTRAMRYAARFTSDCGRYYKGSGSGGIIIDGCKGGRISMAMKFIQLAGAKNFFKFEVERSGQGVYDTDNCPWPEPPTLERWAPIEVPFFKKTYMARLTTMEEVNLYLQTVGPIIINVKTWPYFDLQGPGVYDGFDFVDGKAIIHSMLIVGRGRDDKGRMYYKLRNSHGETWGEKGYLRISRKSMEFNKIMISALYMSANNKP